MLHRMKRASPMQLRHTSAPRPIDKRCLPCFALDREPARIAPHDALYLTATSVTASGVREEFACRTCIQAWFASSQNKRLRPRPIVGDVSVLPRSMWFLPGTPCLCTAIKALCRWRQLPKRWMKLTSLNRVQSWRSMLQSIDQVTMGRGRNDPLRLYRTSPSRLATFISPIRANTVPSRPAQSI